MSKALARSLQNLGENVAEKERKEATTEIDNEEPRSS
jgi:hypothetical protein